ESELTVISPREKDHEYSVDHRGDLFYIRTNKGCRNFRVVTAPVAHPGLSSWKELLPYRSEVMVSGLDLFAWHAVILDREDALPRDRVRVLATDMNHGAECRAPVYAIDPEGHEEFHTALFRFNYQSLTTTPFVYDCDMVFQEQKLLKRAEVLGGCDS